jgi:hypothetical protein
LAALTIWPVSMFMLLGLGDCLHIDVRRTGLEIHTRLRLERIETDGADQPSFGDISDRHEFPCSDDEFAGDVANSSAGQPRECLQTNAANRGLAAKVRGAVMSLLENCGYCS